MQGTISRGLLRWKLEMHMTLEIWMFVDEKITPSERDWDCLQEDEVTLLRGSGLYKNKQSLLMPE